MKMVGARPYWNTGLTPIALLTGALLAGGVFFTFVHRLGGRSQGATAAAGLLIAVNFLAALLYIVPRQVIPELEAPSRALASDRLSVDYFPSLHEWPFHTKFLSIAWLVLPAGYRPLPPTQRKVVVAPVSASQRDQAAEMAPGTVYASN